MKYTISQIAELSGVTKRTLRYYDEISLLKPNSINSSGYRIYTQKEIDRLHQILLYRSLDIDLNSIKNILINPKFDEIKTLKDHKIKLMEKRNHIDNLIKNVKNTLLNKEGKIVMSNEEKFQAFKENLVKENEDKYGEEIREKYGKEQVDKSNSQMLNMTEEQYEELINIEKEMFDNLKIALEKNLDMKSEEGQKAALLHKKWITFSWGKYNEDAHKGVVEMYVADDAFKKYYDDKLAGSAQLLRDAVVYMIEHK